MEPAGDMLLEPTGLRIGRYKLLEKIGEGGFGVVYMAEQIEPVHRRVALKIIKAGMDTHQVVARFEAERQALALMDHPNIARVLDAGTTEMGRPYFVMELVKGIPITDYCDQYRLSPADRLPLFIQVCHAVQHAHQKGIIHRDLKPSNVLVTLHDGEPVPKVIDFGVAKALGQKLTEKTLFTGLAQMIGTPAYMSPEQAELSGLDVDTRSDVYSLGVLLYELLTGTTPFEKETLAKAALDEIRRMIRETEPPKPSTRLHTLGEKATESAQHRHTEARALSRLVRGDLDWIVMKCLEKDRTRRYETANSLAQDIEHHLNQQPVSAVAPSALYRAGKFARRHKVGLVMATAIVLLLVAGAVVSTWQAVRATRAEREQSRLRELAQQAEAKEVQLRRQADEARTRAEANEQKAVTAAVESEQVAKFLEDMLEGVGPSVALGRDTKLLQEILDKTADRLGRELTNQPAVEAKLRSTIGEVYRALGKYKEAAELHQQALAARKHLLGAEHPDVADSLCNVAYVFYYLGKYAEAESIYREALAMRRRLLGEEHAAVATTMNGLANVLAAQLKVSEAEKLHQAALGMQTKLLGYESLSVAMTLNNLGTLMQFRGKIDDAENFFTKSLAIRRKLCGDGTPDVASSIHNLGRCAAMKGDFAKAEARYAEALAMRKRLYDGEHPVIASNLEGLAMVEWRQGHLDKAAATHREALVMRRRLLGAEHLDIARSLNNLALVLRDQGKLGEAEENLRAALVMRRKFLEPDHDDVCDSSRLLAQVLIAEGKLPEAEIVARESHLFLREIAARKPDKFFSNLSVLADILMRQGKEAEVVSLHHEAANIDLVGTDGGNAQVMNTVAWFLATSQYQKVRDGRRAVDFAEKAVAATDRKDPAALDTLAAAYAEAGEFDKAVRVQQEAIALVPTNGADLRVEFESRLRLFEAHTPYHDHAALATMADTLLAQGKFAEADPAARECLAIREKLIPDHWLTFNTRSLLGGSLLGQKKYADAEPLLRSAYQGMRQREATIPAAGKVRLKQALERLVQLYEATGRLEQAVEWKKKLAASGLSQPRTNSLPPPANPGKTNTTGGAP